MVLLSPIFGSTLAWFSTCLTVASLQLVERRGRGRRIGGSRQVELATMLDSIPDCVFLFDNYGRMEDCNRLAEELCGRSSDALRGTSIADLNRLLSARDEHDSPVEKPSMGVNRALRGEIVRNVRRVFRHPRDGRVIETVTSASPLHEASGEASGALLIVRDVTETAQLQRRLADSQRHKEVGQMAAGLAHDFNNVLDTISQISALLEMSEDHPAQDRRTYIAMIRKAVERGAEITDRVRDYLRSGSGRQSAVDLCAVVHDALELTHPLWQGRQDVKVETEVAQVPPVMGNASDLRRVFTNLVINALEAMPAGGQLRVRCEAVGNCVRTAVSDTGQGISPENQKHLFLPYFTTKAQGTGLGLSGAQRVVNGLHGHIDFHSELGKGTTFIVDLPVATAGDISSTRSQEESHHAREEEAYRHEDENAA